jgi:hypothetical protein
VQLFCVLAKKNSQKNKIAKNCRASPSLDLRFFTFAAGLSSRLTLILSQWKKCYNHT